MFRLLKQLIGILLTHLGCPEVGNCIRTVLPNSSWAKATITKIAKQVMNSFWRLAREGIQLIILSCTIY